MYTDIVQRAKEIYLLIFEFIFTFFDFVDCRNDQLEEEQLTNNCILLLTKLKGTIDELDRKNLFIPVLEAETSYHTFNLMDYFVFWALYSQTSPKYETLLNMSKRKFMDKSYFDDLQPELGLFIASLSAPLLREKLNYINVNGMRIFE